MMRSVQDNAREEESDNWIQNKWRWILEGQLWKEIGKADHAKDRGQICNSGDAQEMQVL